ncbi:acyltransferase family protein [Oerskovia flava]|uniref:acyltransferase family protein n=1 Tax=Oerskovia flava TaxID=2986422 RepID=UPI00223F8D15|nr:acyltransferase family protein [Oerskovia sp. JB1-3-2]
MTAIIETSQPGGPPAAGAAAAPAPEAPRPLPSTYYRAVDGLRGVTVLSVLMYHTNLYHNGLFGVDLFMVLSGFLITVTLLREQSRSGRISLKKFYTRRAKRLLVPLIVVLGATAVAAIQLGRSDEADRVFQQGIASLFYVANWEQIARGESYWDAMGIPGPLAHMWSLSLTEQFYLLWPPLLVLVCAVVVRRSDVVVALLAGSLAAVMTVVTILSYDGTNADLLYMGTHTHGVGLMVGAGAGVVAVMTARRRAAGVGSRLPRALAELVTTGLLLAIITVSVGTATYEDPWLYAGGGMTIVALMGAGLILALTREDTLVARMFTAAPLVGIGKFSYALFLVHLPVFWVLQKILSDPSPVYIALYGIPLSIVLAAFLHHIVGEPVRIRRWNRAGGIAFVTLAAVATTGMVLAPTIVRQAAGSGDLRVLFLGDSLGHDFASALTDFRPDDFTVTDGAFNGCGIYSPETSRTTAIEQGPAPGCLPWEDRWRDAVNESQPDVVVINVAWDGAEQRVDGQWADPCAPAYAERYERQLDTATQIATAADPDRRVLLATSRKFTPIAAPEWAACHTELLRAHAEQQPAVDLLELHDFVCTETECLQTTPDGAPVYIDTVHFSRAGMAWIAPWLGDAIKQAAGGAAA